MILREKRKKNIKSVKREREQVCNTVKKFKITTTKTQTAMKLE